MGTESARWIAGAVASLKATFGDELTLCRAGASACWAYAGQAVFVELAQDGAALAATFIERPAQDFVSGSWVSGVYRKAGASYSLTAAGCARMVGDLVDFFSGIREPQFAFVAVRSPEGVRH